MIKYILIILFTINHVKLSIAQKKAESEFDVLNLSIIVADSKSSNPIENANVDIYIEDTVLLLSEKSNKIGEVNFNLNIHKKYVYKIKVYSSKYIHKIFEINTKNVLDKTRSIKPLNLGFLLFTKDSLADNSILDLPGFILKFNQKNYSFEQDEEYSKMTKIILSSINNLWAINRKNKIQKEQEYKIKLKEEENKMQAKEISMQKIIRKLILSCVILLIVFLIFVFISLSKSKKTNKIIAQQKIEVEKQKHLVEEKQKEIVDSITYAKRLQHAILPPTEFIKTNFPESFILYKPKDIVAGDFYWAKQINDLFFITAADCTGHGVPGALVSIVCSNALDRTVKEFALTDTGKILDKTRELVIETFEKSNTEIKDGMDISLLCIDKRNQKVFWSGANNPLWFVNNNELIEIKADKQPVGKSYETKSFTSNKIEYKINTTFYLFTDGLADQFGGPKGKKFKYKQFEEILISINNKSMQEQSEIINKKFEEWKGTLEQVDDVCIIGIKI